MNRSASGSPVAAPDCGAGCSSVGQWLAGLGLGDYESLFHNNGFDDLDFIVSSYSNWRMSGRVGWSVSSSLLSLRIPYVHMFSSAPSYQMPLSLCGGTMLQADEVIGFFS
jgi:hypothetical protein